MSKAGYVEEEYALSGRANTYGYVDSAAQSPQVEVIERGVPYTTRLLVRRPREVARFNGTVFLEILNATAGWDGDPIWQSTYPFLVREGATWVGITAKPVTVDFLRDGWAAAPNAKRNASRYAELSMPHFGQVWDMLAQAALLLKTPDADANPLQGFPVERVVLVGYSQSAGYQVTFANSFHAAAVMRDGTPVIDGYYIAAGRETAKHVTGPTDATPEVLPPGDPRNRVLTAAPTMRFQTQTEVVGAGFNAQAVRQSERDNPWLRFYEMAGGAHVDVHLNRVGGQALVRDLGLPASFCPEPQWPYNPISIGDVQSALLQRLERWIGEGAPPPSSRFLELEHSDPPRIRLDEDGNAIGGVRHPQIEVPLGAYLADNAGPGFCTLYGGFRVFDASERNTRYGDQDGYIEALGRAVEQTRAEGFLLEEESQRILIDAPARFHGGEEALHP